MAEIPPEKLPAVQIVMLEVAQAQVDAQTAFANAIKASGLDQFGLLINNQPQASISASRSFRDDLFGPDLLTARFTYERGLSNNLNGFFDRIDQVRCNADVGACLKEYSSYVNDPETKAQIKAASRLSAFAEVTKHADYHYTNASAGLDLAVSEGTTVLAGLDYGRLLGVSDTGVADGRIDAGFQYEFRSEAPEETRLVASITITKKFGDVSIPFGIVYANKPR